MMTGTETMAVRPRSWPVAQLTQRLLAWWTIHRPNAPHWSRRTTATVVGSGAVVVWATGPSLATAGTDMAPLAFVAGSFACGFVIMVAARAVRRQHVTVMFAVPAPTLALMVGGFLGHNALFLTAFRFANAGQVTIVSYLWPLLMIAIVAATGQQRPNRRQWLGIALGFVGFCWFAFPGSATDTAGASRTLIGLLLALAAATSFATYSALRTRVPAGPPDAVGTALGVAAVGAFATHLAIGSGGFDPSTGALLAMVAMGAGPMGLANIMWDHGLRHGDPRILSASAYLTPLLSTALLVTLGLASLTTRLAIGALIVIAGIVINATAPNNTDR